jgi:hypothetical protein
MSGSGVSVNSLLANAQTLTATGNYFTSCSKGGVKTNYHNLVLSANYFGLSPNNEVVVIDHYQLEASSANGAGEINDNIFSFSNSAALKIESSINLKVMRNHFGYDINKNPIAVSLINPGSASVAIETVNGSSETLGFNNIINYSTGIKSLNAKKSSYDLNSIVNTALGVEITNGIGVTAKGNTITGGLVGLTLSKATDCTFEGNTLKNISNVPVKILGQSSLNEFVATIIFSTLSTPTPSGILITGGSNKNTVRLGSIFNCEKGVQIEGTSTGNVVSQVSIAPTVSKAIALTTSTSSSVIGNGGKGVPEIKKIRIDEQQNLVLLVEAVLNDKIEIFVSSPGVAQEEKLSSFLIDGVLDNVTKRELIVNRSALNSALGITDEQSKVTYYFRATATSSLLGTSPASGLKSICPNCECIVTSTLDGREVPAGSLREAIINANDGQCGKVIFNITNTSDLGQGIEILTELPDIAGGYSIDGSTQPGYNAANYPVILIKGSTQIKHAFNVVERNATIKGVGISGFVNGIVLGSSKGHLSAISVGNTDGSYLLIKSTITDGQNNIENSYFGTTINGKAEGNVSTSAAGIEVGNKNNVFTNCHISNSQRQNIVFKTGSASNTFNGGSLTNSGKFGLDYRSAITFEGAGVQNDVKAPVIASHMVSNGQMELTIKTINTDDVLQIYQSVNTPQQAVQYLSQVDFKIKPGSTAPVTEWIAVVKGTYDPAGKYFFVATTTDRSGNTSPVSKLYKVNSDYEICTVSVLNETGPGSIRAAVECINNADGKARMAFEFPEDGIEKSINILAQSKADLALRNAHGVLIDPSIEQKILINGNEKVEFQILGPNVIIENLNLSKINMAIKSGADHVLSNMTFAQSTLAVSDLANNVNIEGNEFRTDARLVVSKSIKVRISRNLFLNPASKGKANAISLVAGGNNNKSKPEIELVDLYQGKLRFQVKTQTANETVELFLGAPEGQRALKYINTFKTGVSREVTADVNIADIRALAVGQTELNLVGTARDDAGNTSELTANLPITTCLVTNNSDNINVSGSLRSSVDLVNKSQCNVMAFAIPEPLTNEIKLGSELPMITKKVIMDATSLQPGYLPNNAPVVKITSGNGTLSNGIKINAAVTINGLVFEKFANGISVIDAEEKLTLRNVHFKKSDKGLLISGKSKNITAELCQWGDATLGSSNGIGISQDKGSLVRVSKSTFYLESNSTAYSANGATGITLNDNILEGLDNLSSGSISTGFNISNTNNLVLSKCTLTNVGSAIVVKTVTGTIEGNHTVDFVRKEKPVTLPLLGTAISVDNCVELSVGRNQILDYRNVGISIKNSVSDKNKVFDNNIGNAKAYGIELISVSNHNIGGNSINGSEGVGIFVDQNSPSNHLTTNQLRQCLGHAIWVKGGNTKIMGNLIGDLTKPTKDSKMNGIGLLLESSNNIIGSEKGTNYFYRNTKGGIINKGNKNRIIYNEFQYNDVSDRISVAKAISNGGTWNDNIQAPAGITSKKEGVNYVLKGTALASSIVHFYRSDGFPQNAKLSSIKVITNSVDENGKPVTKSVDRPALIAEAITNSSGVWSTTITKEQLDPSHTTYIVCTATTPFKEEQVASTSELSAIIPIGPCIISNNEDVADDTYPVIGSYRAAIGCANKVTEAPEIVTKIAGIPTITLEANVPSITNGYGALKFSGKNLATEPEVKDPKNPGSTTLSTPMLHIQAPEKVSLQHALSLALPKSGWETKSQVEYITFSGFSSAVVSTHGFVAFNYIKAKGRENGDDVFLKLNSGVIDLSISGCQASQLKRFISVTNVDDCSFAYLNISGSTFDQVETMIAPLKSLNSSNCSNNTWRNSKNIFKGLNFDWLHFTDNKINYDKEYNGKEIGSLFQFESSQSLYRLYFLDNTISAKDCENYTGNKFLISLSASTIRYCDFKNNEILVNGSNRSNTAGGFSVGGLVPMNVPI